MLFDDASASAVIEQLMENQTGSLKQCWELMENQTGSLKQCWELMENQTRSLKHCGELREMVACVLVLLVKEIDSQHEFHLPDQKYAKLYKYYLVTIARE